MHVGSLALMLFLLPAYLGALRARLDGRCGVVSGVVEDSPGSSLNLSELGMSSMDPSASAILHVPNVKDTGTAQCDY